MQTNKEKYRNLCQNEKSLPIFLNDWWLDAVCTEDHWDVALTEKGGEVFAAFPYYKMKIMGMNILAMPKLTPVLGPWIKYPEDQKYTTKLSHEKSVMTDLIGQMPRFDYFYQNFHYSLTNWLPFYWKGFKQTTIYTYVIEDLSSVDGVFQEFRDNIKREIRKAEKEITIDCHKDIEKVYALAQMTFERQKKRIPFSLETLKNIDSACAAKNCRKTFFAKDEKGEIQAALYIVWDENSAYYLVSGANPEYRNSGAGSLLTWEAIKFASTITKRFDFEGSIIEPIERFFRSFGSVQKPFFNITKTNSIVLKILKLFISKNNIKKVANIIRLKN